MWKARPDEKVVTPTPGTSTRPISTNSPSHHAPAPTTLALQRGPVSPPTRVGDDGYRAEIAHIGKSVVLKGELSGSEDLYLDGEVEGSIELKQHSLTIGPHGRVRANIHAREVMIYGKADGNVRADEKVELRKSAILAGDILTQRIIIEEGAYFKGSVEIEKNGKAETQPGRREMSFSAASGSSS